MHFHSFNASSFFVIVRSTKVIVLLEAFTNTSVEPTKVFDIEFTENKLLLPVTVLEETAIRIFPDPVIVLDAAPLQTQTLRRQDNRL